MLIKENSKKISKLCTVLLAGGILFTSSKIEFRKFSQNKEALLVHANSTDESSSDIGKEPKEKSNKKEKSNVKADVQNPDAKETEIQEENPQKENSDEKADAQDHDAKKTEIQEESPQEENSDEKADAQDPDAKPNVQDPDAKIGAVADVAKSDKNDSFGDNEKNDGKDSTKKDTAKIEKANAQSRGRGISKKIPDTYMNSFSNLLGIAMSGSGVISSLIASMKNKRKRK